MRTVTSTWGAITATAVVLALLAPGPTGAAAPDDGDRSSLQARLDDVVAAGAVGAMAQVQDGRQLWLGTSGVAELDTRQPVPVRGRFRAGSITKTFVATVVLQLVDEGRLSLDDTVESWLPGAVPDGRRITVRQLMNHTSGLYDYLHTLPMPPSRAFWQNRWRDWSAVELVDRAVAHPPTHQPPGSAFAYSNTNYTLLGELIEVVTGRRYGDEVERRIIGPLRLRHTSMPGSSPDLERPRPRGYLPATRGGEVVLRDYTRMNPSVMGAGGELISTTRDLDRFFVALLGGELLPDHLLREMQTPGVPGRPYGLGLAWRDTACGVRLYGNDGDALAYTAWSFTSADRSHRVTVALTPDFTGDPDEAVDRFIEHAVCG